MQATKTNEVSRTRRVLLTCEAGHYQTEREPLEFVSGSASGEAIEVFPDNRRQLIDGIGTSFTESSAYVLAHLPIETRKALMQEMFGAQGANFSMARAVIAATDFSVAGRFSYCDTPGDTELKNFSIDADTDGFSRQDHEGIVDESYDVLPMIKEALEIKRMNPVGTLKIIASAWTAPSWMKDNEDWYTPPTESNHYQGTGGSLKPGMEKVFAEYLVRYLQAYAGSGVMIWGITPVNEPLGNNGQWESMHFTPESQQRFIRDHLGPAMQRQGVALFAYDHNRSDLGQWADAICSDPETSRYVDGAAVHWYDSTCKVYEDVLDEVHERFPDLKIIHTEGCIDDLGNKAPEGVLDPERYCEQDWFGNDDFWWNDNATDWAYTATWHGVTAEDHPIYTPVHRYARDIIGCINSWVTGWIDWNIVLDARGGPNHVGNYCGAPVMIDTDNGEIYRTPVFHVLSQFSRTIRPLDRAVELVMPDSLSDNGVFACATISPEGVVTVQCLNTSKASRQTVLQIGDRHSTVSLHPNSLLTIQL